MTPLSIQQNIAYLTNRMGPVFDKLKVWRKDISGQDALKSLAELGVGAISPHAVATPFDLKTTDNRLLGSVRQVGLVA